LTRTRDLLAKHFPVQELTKVVTLELAAWKGGAQDKDVIRALDMGNTVPPNQLGWLCAIQC